MDNKIQFLGSVGKFSKAQIIKAENGAEKVLIDGIELPNVSTYSLNVDFHKMPTFSVEILVDSFEIMSPDERSDNAIY